MMQHSFLNLKKGEYLQIYNAGNLEGSGTYLGLFEDNGKMFLCYQNEYLNKQYTNIDFISVERLFNQDNDSKYPDCNCDANYND
ncbi:hypothetical protein [Bacillus thuringiensis]|uniref:hypothetical protein n=1 Tax=Bacillus thuringiensis TaxID=1428 RepID=UPI000A3C057D|nr:hypothetical protein [Bacillus thuringiensis]OUA83536.1 hypothetical protein BK706_28985 [Bacillus thuringiensis serovar leesis]